MAYYFNPYVHCNPKEYKEVHTWQDRQKHQDHDTDPGEIFVLLRNVAERRDSGNQQRCEQDKGDYPKHDVFLFIDILPILKYGDSHTPR